ncbi:U11/U12 small nuclear ribonucleoprotein 48 kDa protein [Andrographis paniculata]|uniref:U11/U12 small nuclear ribonucleoprotein 48 kDa protein n=1 Tax=Andrographis paniculata TaxID=175694 RepID=UPI0021E88E60|nr:U11/U12 small nuclear ribonucleoprotein 48 kDa protein [Andrographis paniculata]XP_051140046.1 U11/U12 small nuclear ribonucleoprotein 48 kDa protein [Andrographis paniculata]
MNPPPPPPAGIQIPSHSSMRPPPPSPPQRPPSLPTVLSELSSLLQLSEGALRSLPIPTAITSSAALLPCPVNPNHRLLPSSLFSHYLKCPTPISLSHNFHYPSTLNSAAVSPPAYASSSDDVVISLESYMGFKSPANSFFYQNCPGPVTPTEPPPSLTIPKDLYMECAEFDKDTTSKNILDYSVDYIRFLPSEIWAIRSEIEAWGGGLPAAFSCRILRAILRLRDCKLLHLNEWIVSNSPKYGVIVDFALSHHMVLLIRLCLKVVVKDAFKLAGIILENGDLNADENALETFRRFECPVLVKMMMWLSLQFRILYGDGNGKKFTVEVLKKCILKAALDASLFSLEQNCAELEKVNRMQEPMESIEYTDYSKSDPRGIMNIETVGKIVIFISQVAAAVTSFHERSLIEEKIKALRNSCPLPAYQRNMDHEYVSKIANEERQNRLDYRPVIEHDSFLWQRSNNQDTNRVKSREELLAEERDYKRRRMSYRGKKVKRNPVEVMRDIIKEYTDEIKQAEGIADISKTEEVTESMASDDLNAQANATGVSGSRGKSKIPETNRGKSLDYWSEHSYHHYSEGLNDEIKEPRQDLSSDYLHKDLNTKSKIKEYGEGDYFGGQDDKTNNNYFRERVHGRNKQGYTEARESSPQRSTQKRSKSREGNHHKHRDERERYYHKSEREDHARSSHKRESWKDNRKHGERRRRDADAARQDRHEHSEGYDDRKRSKTVGSRSSHPGLHEFDDRYNPSESHGFYGDDF